MRYVWPLLGDVLDRAAARDGRHLVGEEVALGDEHARRARAAGELVRREEDGVLVGQLAVLDRRRRVHVDRQVRRGGRIVPERQRAVAVEQDRDGVDVRDDPGHVRRRREGPDLEGAVVVALELVTQVLEVEPPVGVLADHHDVGGGLAPGQLVRVVLEGPHEDDGSGAPAELEHAHEPVDRARRARPAEDDDVVVPAADRPVDDPAGVLAQLRRPPARGRGLRVGVRVERQHLRRG